MEAGWREFDTSVNIWDAFAGHSQFPLELTVGMDLRDFLFCFVWLATLGMPVVAPGTAAGPFRRVAEAPFWVPSSPVVERGALSTEVPPHLKTR